MANFKIMRNGLNTEIVGDPHIGQSSEDVTVEVTDDGTYSGYTKRLYYSYCYHNELHRALSAVNSNNEFIIPVQAFFEPGMVKLSVELSNGTNCPACNACFLIVTDGAKDVDTSVLPSEKTWQSYIQSYIKSDVNALEKRIDNLILSSGTESSAEVIDARTGYDGMAYNTLGTAIRTQIAEISNNIIERINVDLSGAISGYYISVFHRKGQSSYFSMLEIRNVEIGDKIVLIASGDGSNVAMISSTKDDDWYKVLATSIDFNEHKYECTVTNTDKVVLSYNNTKQVYAYIEKRKFHTNDEIDEKNDEIDEKFKNINSKLETILTPQYMHMFNTIGIVGDSLASGEVYPPTGDTPKDIYANSWLSNICKEIGATPSHYSNGGMMAESWMKDNGGYKTQLLSDRAKNAYYVALGTNDKQYFSVGNVNDTSVANTFAGWYNDLLDTIHNHAPNATIFCVSLYETNTKADSFSNMIKAIAESRNYCYYVDYINSTDSDLIITSVDTNFIHNWHYTGLGYVRVGEIIRRLTNKVIEDNLSNYKYFNYNQ